MKKMIVIFENLDSVHLGKDVGTLPLVLHSNEKWDISLYSISKSFSDYEYEKKVELRFFNLFKSRILNKLILFFHVLKNAKKIDYLMVFHGGVDKYILFYVAKMLNKNLVSYVKLDMGETNARTLINKLRKEGWWRKKIRKFLTASVDLFSVETMQVYDIIKGLAQFENKLHYLPNGFYSSSPYNWNVKKQKNIISVGRIGSSQKNNELLLSAIEQLDCIKDYKFYFIGPIEASFQEKVAKLLVKREDMRHKVILTGNITRKEELYDFYKKAEVVCFTSLHEGFSLVMPEAMYFGCFLVSTDLAAAYDLTDNGKYGEIIEVNELLIDNCEKNGVTDFIKYSENCFDEIISSQWFLESSKKLANSLQSIIDGNLAIESLSHHTAINTYNCFNWISITKKLSTQLESISACKK